MARKRTLSTLDTSISYEAVGLDLAKRNLNREFLSNGYTSSLKN